MDIGFTKQVTIELMATVVTNTVKGMARAMQASPRRVYTTTEVTNLLYHMASKLEDGAAVDIATIALEEMDKQ